MFGFVIDRSVDVVFRYPVNYGKDTGPRDGVVSVERDYSIYRTPCGPVGLFLTRRKYRYMLRDWASSAWSWPCGQQDHYGDMLDAAREDVESFGFNSKIDRDQINLEMDLLNA